MSAVAAEPVPAVQEAAIRLKGVVKSFGANRVLHGVDFEVRKGEVHALIGGNGAGKSTLMKILQGVYTLDEGSIELDGRPVQFRSFNDARANGVGMIFQEFSLVPTLTVAQNIFLNHEPRGLAGSLNDREAERRAKRIFEEMGVEIDPRTAVADLSTGFRQLTEIVKALSQDARILIMDEPNAALSKGETQALFEIIRRLKQQGIAIIYITHRMEEVFEIADRISVLRDGRRVLMEPVANISLPQLVEQMVGGKVEHAMQWRPRQVERSGVPLLEVRDLVAGPRVRGVSFKLYAGEILGLAGLVGSGRSETVRALFGIDTIDSGEVLVRGNRLTIKGSGAGLKAKLGLVPEDRRIEGLVLTHTIRDNLLLPILPSLEKAGLIDDARGDEIVNSYVRNLQVKTDSIRKEVRLLSGGNQQKVVIGKWLATEPDILFLDEPTAGVDLPTKGEIVEIVRRLADSGKGIIMISSELPELLAISDRIVVLRGGTDYRTLDRAELDSHMVAADESRIGVAEEVLHRIIQGESQIEGTGPHGERATPASQVGLSDEEKGRVRALNATAALVFHYTTSDWAKGQLAGLNAQFEAMAIRVVTTTDAGFGVEKQVADLEQVLAHKPDVIVGFPVDAARTAEQFKKAAVAGIKLVFMDNAPEGMEAGRDYVSLVSADNYGCGESSAYILGEHLGGSGKVAALYHDAEFFVTRQRYEAFEQTITRKFPGIELVAKQGVAGPDFREEARKAGASILASHPDVDGIWAVWDELAEGVVAAARAAGRRDLAVVTVDLGEEVAKLLARGDLVVGLSAQRPYDQGATEAILAGYGLLGKTAPAYVALPALSVTRDNLVGAWRTVYRRDPPAGLISTVRS